MSKVWLKSIGLVIGLLIFCATITMALEPPRKGELEQFAKDGSLAKHIEFANRLGNNRLSAGLIQKKFGLAQSKSSLDSFQKDPMPVWVGLSSLGAQKVFALVIDFPDFPYTQDSTEIFSKLFSDGTSSDYPYESLRNYYLRSSYGMLTIEGMVLGPYRAAHNQDYYTGDNNLLIKEALNALDTAVDFSQFDGNGDGYIDYFLVFWNGNIGAWATFWWGYYTAFNEDSFKLDGKMFGSYSWQWASSPPNSTFYPMVALHETGHALGLADLYDYTTTYGPQGGVGGFDMMDGNIGDHNSFSKWLLDWLTPIVIGTPGTDTTFTLRNTAQYPDAVAIMPALDPDYPFTEFYMVQNRYPINNDNNIFGQGLAIWHIDASLFNGAYYIYDNSYADHKLVRLMEADGLEEIERSMGNYDPGDFYATDTFHWYSYTYVLGTTFSTYSFPSSCDYTGYTTGIVVSDISSTGLVMNARFRLVTPSSYQNQISGFTRDTGGNPVKNIQMRLTGRINREDISDIMGNYAFNYLPYGGYTVTPYRNGYRFVPSERVISPLTGTINNQNFIRKFGIDSDKVKLLGRTGGSYNAVAIQGDYAYVAEGGGLTILHISNNTSFQFISQVPLEDVTKRVTVSGDYAYIGDNEGGFYIIDISDPSNPHIISQIYLQQGIFSYGIASDIAIKGNYAYVVNAMYGVMIFDISDPTDPVEVGYYLAPNWCYSIKIVGNYVYLACAYQGLIILDITNPIVPIQVGQCLDIHSAHDVAINGSYAYVADDYYGLVVMDISDPLHPYAVGTSGPYWGAWDWGINVAISGPYAYLLIDGYGFQVIDISIPTSPTVITYMQTPGYATGLTKSGNYLYVAGDYIGLNVIDVSLPTSPVEKGAFSRPGVAYNATINGNYAYVAGWDSGLCIYDLSNPALPNQVSQYTTTYFIGSPCEVTDVVLRNQYAYMADMYNGIAILNISNPANPVRVGGEPFIYGYPYGLFLRDSCLFIAQGYEGLGIMNISNPTNPVYIVETTAVSGNAYSVAVNGNYAYLATGTDGLRVVNISNISSPVNVGHYSSPAKVWWVAASGNYAYLAGDTAGMIIVDISNPTNPVEVGRFTPAGKVYGVKVVGTKAYVAADTAGLRIVDVSNPASPNEVAYYDTPSSAWGVGVDGFNVVEANENGGAWFFQYPIGGATKVDDHLWMLY
jgi:M6 family metalloprotease-like protein